MPPEQRRVYLIDPLPNAPRRQVFRFEPARDLLGILRTMYAVERAAPYPRDRRLRQIERMARELAGAIKSAGQHDPGTAPYERALSRADGVAARVMDLLDILQPLEPVLKTSGDRVRGTYRTERSAWEMKWATRIKRG